MAAATSYANHGIGIIPFYIFYSMFGFQRVGDFIWAAGDMRARGFLLGATAGRTTLAGEGLQHQDGHSQLLATTVPNCRAYDPTFAYELAVIMQEGMQRMYGEGEGIFYYISLMNENYSQPAMPADVAPGILKGGYLLRQGPKGKVRATLLGSGTILREVIAAAELLDQDFKIPADVYSITSFSELRREALGVERWNLLNPGEPPRQSYVHELLGGIDTPIVAATDYMRTVADQIRAWLPPHYLTLGTDGFGRSDARAELRAHFEVDRRYVALAALKGLADMGQVDRQTVVAAAAKLRIDPAKPNPLNS
jgi:pyruvate dehydrogenase E1 component